MDSLISNDERDRLLQRDKRLGISSLNEVDWGDKRVHRECNLKATGEKGRRFELRVRINTKTPLDFSVIVALQKPDSNRRIHLRRYNGWHEHSNPFEDETFKSFHIHRITERYQQSEEHDEDKFAKSTDRYEDVNGAWECAVADCSFVLPDDGQMTFSFGQDRDSTQRDN